MYSLNFHKWNGGSRKTTPILALHGFMGSGLDFQCFVESTSDLYSWWAPDLMGHGGSPVPEDTSAYTASAHMNYLDKIVQKIDSPFILLGYSMGGRLALRYALERPGLVSALILVGTTPGIRDLEERRIRRESDEKLAEYVITEGIEKFLQKWKEQPLIRTQSNIVDSLYKAMFERRRRNVPLGLANSLRGMGTGEMESLWDNLANLKCPVFLCTGETDRKFFDISVQMKDKVPSFKHEVIPKAGHAAIWENFAYFTRLLQSGIRDRSL